MNIKQYLDNPMGKGAIIQGKQFIIDDLNKRYEKLLLDKKFEVESFKDGDNYIFHIKVPSESERENTYDVVLEFYPKDATDKADESIQNYELKFFSNCPSFIFTYAYAYKLHGHFIEELSKKLDDQIFKQAPVIKNPSNIVNFEKSLYFACKYLIEEKSLLKNYLKSMVQRYKKREFHHSIRTQEEIMNEIKREKNKIKIEKDKIKQEEKRPKRTKNIMNDSNSPKSVNIVNPKQSSGKSTINKVNKINPKKSTSKSKSSVSKVNKIKGKR